MLTHISFGEGPKDLAILVPTKDFNEKQIRLHYVEPLVEAGIKEESIIAFNLAHNAQGKAPVSTVIRPWLEKLEKALSNLKISYVLIAEPNYFKTICKERKADVHYGYVKPTIWPNIQGILTTNYKALMFNEAAQQKIDLSIKAVALAYSGKSCMFSKSVLAYLDAPIHAKDIRESLDRLMERPAVTVDIETYSLRVDQAKIASIAFGIDTASAVAFLVGKDQQVKNMLREFFLNYKGGLIFHNATYDVKVLIWNLFMQHPTDYRGMHRGLQVFNRKMHDTKVLAFLALNSCVDISLSLKDLAFEHTGNYATVYIQDITKITTSDLLEYNAMDAIATWYVYSKYRQIVREEQEEVYQKVYRPTLRTLTMMELCGQPINMGAVLIAEKELDKVHKYHLNKIWNHPEIHKVNWLLRNKAAEKANEKLKVKKKTVKDFLDFQFNPNSNQQLAVLFHEQWDLPVLETTPSGAPSTSSDVIEALIQHTEDSVRKELLTHIKELHEVSKILNTFIPAFKNNTITKENGNTWSYLHGCFNIGPKSGRLSSSDPNLQNLPSTGKNQYSELVKGCFQAPKPNKEEIPEWLWVGADYESLEDRISALLTKDPNKLAVYTDGYDGHCLRAFSYFKEQMPDIAAEIEAMPENKVEIINSIKKRYPNLRQDSKGPTFLLTYMGTWKGLQKTFGFSTTEAQEIERKYHELYAVADKWVLDKLEEASRTGYVELAFGLKLRTPLLKKVIFNSSSMPFQAHQEMKTAGNALCQSYGLLNSHSANMFLERARKSKWRYSILPTLQVHDSQYYLIKNSLQCLKWTNDNLIECMEWADLDPIKHDQVKLGAQLELYHPTWNDKISIPNRASISELKEIIKNR